MKYIYIWFLLIKIDQICSKWGSACRTPASPMYFIESGFVFLVLKTIVNQNVSSSSSASYICHPSVGITWRKCHEEDEFRTILMIEADWMILVKMQCIVPLIAFFKKSHVLCPRTFLRFPSIGRCHLICIIGGSLHTIYFRKIKGALDFLIEIQPWNFQRIPNYKLQHSHEYCLKLSQRWWRT